MNDLTPKQAAFVREYLVDTCATKAAIRAGYAVTTAEHQASRLLANVGVAAAVQAGLTAKANEAGITRARVSGMVLEALAEARADRAHGAVVRGIELLAKLHGHVVARTDARVVRSLQDLTDDELTALTAEQERFAGLPGAPH